jgi:rfaE bifunctional protein nucleotidyltransferase chain/domain
MSQNSYQTYPTPSFESKILPLGYRDEDLMSQLAKLPKPIVFTNGVFDILHRGHVTYLAQARELGKSLVLGLNSDRSVKLLGKGDDRPINQESDRMAVLAALEAVDLVVCFNEKTPVELIAKIRPEIYVKGGDYEIEKLAETDLVKSWGAKAYAIPFLHERSTTTLLGKIRK